VEQRYFRRKNAVPASPIAVKAAPAMKLRKIGYKL
jgi:hypothetical protein